MTNANIKYLELIGGIGDDLILRAEEPPAPRARAWIKLLPVAAALMALAVIAVSLLPGMLGTTPPATTEREYLRITDIPGAVEVDHSELKNELPENMNSFPLPLDTVIENLSDQSMILGAGTIKNMQTVCFERDVQILDINGESTGKKDTIYYYITTFDLTITKAIRNIEEEATVKCAVVRPWPIKISNLGNLFPPQAIYNIGKPMLHEAEYLYCLSKVGESTWTFNDKDYTVSDFADYYFTCAYLHEGDSFYYFNTKINYDEIK